MYKTLTPSTKGCIDSTSRLKGSFGYCGWCFNMQHGVCPLRVVCDEKVFDVSVQQRCDISEYYKSYRHINIIECGWMITFTEFGIYNLQMKFNGLWNNIFTLSYTDDFNVTAYKELNWDLTDMSDLNAKSHYETNGYLENRKYKYEHLPDDFNVTSYKELNEDLKDMSDLNAKSHYEINGYLENRKYKYEQLPNYVERHLNFDNLQTLNCLKNEIVSGNLDVLFAINANRGGGSYKWMYDIELCLNVKIIEISSLRELNDLIDNDFINNQSKIIIQSLLFCDITIEYLLLMHSKFNFKILIPIHDWYWFVYPIPTKYCNEIHYAYLNVDSINGDVKKLFDISYKILCPSDFVYNKVIRLYNNDNVVRCTWVDYSLNTQMCKNVFQPINKNTINIAVMTELSKYKGMEQCVHLKDKFTRYNDFEIKLLFVGVDIPLYEDNINEYIEYIKRYDIHGLLHLNMWGETWSYTLTKSLLSGLPIMYNNIGSFIERIPKNIEKYIINANNESEFGNFEQLNINFTKLIDVIIKNNGSYYNTRLYYSYYINDTFKDILCNNYLVNHIKKYAVYFPQFHNIEENNVNFYKSYTDIINLKHLNRDNKETPNLSLLKLKSIDDYDLLKNTHLISRQVDLLVEHNIDGFAMYYYWFSTNTITNSNRIMDKATDIFLNMDMKYKKIFYIWANENWSDNPAFGNSKNIVKNDYNDIETHCCELIKSFKKDNYLKINNKPVFFIHHPWVMNMDQIIKFKEMLNDKCIENNFDGLEFKLNGMMNDNSNADNTYYDFHPHYKHTNSIYQKDKQIVLDYSKYVANDVNCNSNVQTLFFDFDNSARLSNPDRLNCSTICINNTEHNFLLYINKLKNYYRSNKPNETAMILINAWNEWGERMSIEPSEQRGCYYLDLINEYLRV